MLQYLADGEYLDRQLTSDVIVQAATYNPDTHTFGYGKLTFTFGGDGFVTMKSWVMGLPAVDYSGYINTRQYGLFIPDWFVVVLAVVYVCLTMSDIIRSYFHQSKIRCVHFVMTTSLAYIS